MLGVLKSQLYHASILILLPPKWLRLDIFDAEV